MIKLDRQNFIVGCVAVVIGALMLIGGIAWTGDQVTDSVTRRHAAGYEACSHAEPSQVVACIALVKR